MNIANRITLSRIALVPIFLWAIEASFPYHEILALCLFIVASLTDAVDGYVARRMGQVTNFGKFIDPLADKLLVMSALLVFVARQEMAAEAAILIIAREFLVTSLRMVAVAQGKVIAAGPAGKIKTFAQIIGIAFLLTGMGQTEILEGITIGAVVVWLMVAVTVWSGVVYIVEHRDVLKQEK